MTTDDLIRDRIITVISGLTPTSISRDKFVAYRNEGGADFLKWADQTGDGALRRFQVRDDGSRPSPAVSNGDLEEQLVVFTIYVAYPKDSRAGHKNALDRDRMMSEDEYRILYNIGYSGASNFTSPYPDASWREGSVDRIQSAACDFIRIRQTMGYYRAAPP